MNNSNIFYIMVASLVIINFAIAPAQSQVAKVVDDVCLGCICEAISGCNQTETCSGDVCGIFRITWFYWADSGKLTVNGEAPESPTAFENCALNSNCATQTVQNYMQTFKQDCNGDKKIDCYDYATIHSLGGYGCPGRIFGTYAKVLNQCLSAYIPPETDDLEQPTTIATPNIEVKPTDITTKKPPQITDTVKLQENTTETKQIQQSEEIIQNFDYVVNIPPVSVLEIISSNENTTTTSPLDRLLTTITGTMQDNVTGIKQSEDIVQNFDYSVTIPEVSVLELIRPKENISIASPLNSPAIFQSDISAPAPSAKNDISDIESMIPLPTPVKKKKPSSLITSRKLPTSKDLIPSELDRMVETENDYNVEQLRMQGTLLEALSKRNRIEKEGNEILKEIAENVKQRGIAIPDETQLKIQTIEINQERLFNILERLEKIQKDHNEKHLRFQDKILEEFIRKNSIAEERNEILKEIAKNIKKPDDNRTLLVHICKGGQ